MKALILNSGTGSRMGVITNEQFEMHDRNIV